MNLNHPRDSGASVVQIAWDRTAKTTQPDHWAPDRGGREPVVQARRLCAAAGLADGGVSVAGDDPPQRPPRWCPTATGSNTARPRLTARIRGDAVSRSPATIDLYTQRM